jgi:hypothetical protein
MIGSIFWHEAQCVGAAEYRKSRSGPGGAFRDDDLGLDRLPCRRPFVAHDEVDKSLLARLALGLGVLAAAILFMVGVGPRSDFAMPIHTLRFDLKFVEALALAFATLLLCFRLMRPDARIGTLALCLAASFLPPRARFSHNLIVTFRSLPPKRESMATDEVLCRRW